MNEFKLKNLRELSTEEQLRLQGGSESSCSTCSCPSCSCDCGEHPSNSTHSDVNDVKTGATNTVKSAKGK